MKDLRAADILEYGVAFLRSIRTRKSEKDPFETRDWAIMRSMLGPGFTTKMLTLGTTSQSKGFAGPALAMKGASLLLTTRVPNGNMSRTSSLGILARRVTR